MPDVENIIQYHQKAIDILKQPGKIADEKTQVRR